MPDTPETPHVLACGALIHELGGLVRLNRVISGDVSRETGLAPNQLSLLAMLDSLGEARLADVAEQHMVDPSVISRQVAGLEQAGHVHRRPDPGDRRATLVSLTDEGRAALTATRRIRTARISDALSAWDAEEVERLAAALGRIGNELEAARARSIRSAVRA
ncbi:MarR family winged helix-turn-helix transcriptional regulator [Georgenia wangjunii]|uniref:MarR family winged helix-turn-helix transcriptional regulator n=1 Tax=Georgenia wangjunii TaxID=3117730 RepID=UPI002F2620E6